MYNSFKILGQLILQQQLCFLNVYWLLLALFADFKHFSLVYCSLIELTVATLGLSVLKVQKLCGYIMLHLRFVPLLILSFIPAS